MAWCALKVLVSPDTGRIRACGTKPTRSPAEGSANDLQGACSTHACVLPLDKEPQKGALFNLYLLAPTDCYDSLFAAIPCRIRQVSSP